ncbi:MAG: biopolymer transporter ExbD [Gemmatimonadaceae bacterium]|nr:biopolymer transporter ExbD [Gemmatimonadaceae bacterium]
MPNISPTSSSPTGRRSMASAWSDQEDAITGINVTPLVDVTLVLLIIFMVTTSYIVKAAIELDLPQAATASQSRPASLSVTLTRQGELYLNNRPTSEQNLATQVRAEVATDPDVQVLIAADTELPYGRVVGLIDLIRQSGVRRYALNVAYEDRPTP